MVKRRKKPRLVPESNKLRRVQDGDVTIIDCGEPSLASGDGEAIIVQDSDDARSVSGSTDNDIPSLRGEDSEDEEEEVSTDEEALDDPSDLDGINIDWMRVNRTSTTPVERILDSDDDEPPKRCGRVQEDMSTCRRTGLPRSIPDRTLPDIGFTPEQAWVLACFGLPRVVWLMLSIMHRAAEFSNEACLDCVDFFSGEQACTNAFAAAGLRAIGYDVLNDAVFQDLCGVLGMISALQHVRMLVPGYGLVWLGTVCSTWVFVSRNSTMRTDGNARGDISRRCVRRGNRQAARSALIMALCFSLRLGFCLEHPGSSILFRHPALLCVQRVALAALSGRWHQVSTYMAHFEALHVKKTELLSNESWIHHLERGHPGRRIALAGGQPTCTKRTRADGRKQCSGNGAHLKNTQTYTACFGTSVCGAFVDLRTYYDDVPCERRHCEVAENDGEDGEDAWADLDLDACAAFLRDRCR